MNFRKFLSNIENLQHFGKVVLNIFWSEVSNSGSFVQIWHKCFIWNFSIKFRTFWVCYGWLAFLLYYWLKHIFFKKTIHFYWKNAKLSPRNFLYCICFDTLLQRACYREESAKLHGLHGNVGYVGAWIVWVKFLHGLSGLRGSKYFFTWVIIFTWVKYIFVLVLP